MDQARTQERRRPPAGGIPLCCLCALLVLAACPPAAGELLVGTVVGVSDGDTLTVLDSGQRQHKVRLLGIDAPEKAQAYGRRSRENLSRLAFAREVRVEWQKRDRYGRVLGKVLAPPGDCGACPKTLDAGLAQVNDGMAWWYARYAKDQAPADRGPYQRAEREAQQRRAGLWDDADPVPPWAWRHRPPGSWPAAFRPAAD